MLKLSNIYKRVSLELGLNKEDVKEAYNLYWEYFKKSIESLPLKEDLNEEDFDSLKTSFNIPSLGKFYCTYDRYLRMKNKLKKSRNVENN